MAASKVLGEETIADNVNATQNEGRKEESQGL